MSELASDLRSLVERLTASTGRAWHAFRADPPRDEQFLHRLLRNLPGMAYRCLNDAAWTMEYVSPGCRDLTGFDPQDLIGSDVVSFATLIHPADRQRVWDAVQRAVLAEGTFKVTYRLRRADGQQRMVWEQGCAVVGPRGVEAIEGFITDVTSLADLETRVAEQGTQFTALVEQALVGVYTLRDGRFTYVNQRMADTLGHTVDELLSLNSVQEIVHPDDRESVATKMRDRLDGKQFDAHYEVRVVGRDGEIREVEIHGRRIELDGTPALMGVVLDVTQRKREQRRYHTAQKLEALGQLATGVAHDLNNFLTLIKVTAQVLIAERHEDAALVADLEEIVSGVERGSALSRQLMHFGKPRKASESRASLQDIVEGVRPILTRVAGSGVIVRTRVEDALPDVAVAPSQLEEIVLNLALNACDAMPDGGELRIAAETATGSEERTGARREDHVVVAVSDTGTGIDEESTRLVFEPYYTTKGDRGTGLGLANVWRIAVDAGGFVDVESEVGRGSTFRVHLPIAQR